MKLLVIAATALWCCSSVVGQTFSANLTGTVTDPAGAVIPGAETTLKNTDSGELRKAATDQQGRYSFSQVAPGTYSLNVTQSGFRAYLQTGIILTANQSMDLDVRLVVGLVTESIEVTGAAPILDTQTSNESNTLTTSMLANLPMANRAALSLVVAAAAGASYSNTGVFGPGANDDQNVARFNLYGGRQNSTAILIDGVPSTVGDWGGLLAEPGADSVQDMQVIRNTYEAQYGRSSAGVVNMTTRGGTDKYHGTAFEYFRNNELNANDFWSNLNGLPKAKSTRNQLGGNFSGPIWKKRRLYGFFGYEHSQYGQPGTLTTTVPTLLQRQGNFSQTFNANGTLQTVYDPTTTVQTSTPGVYTRSPFPGNVIPQTNFDAIAKNYIQYIPLPNVPGNSLTGANNFFGSGVAKYTNYHGDGRVDFNPTDKHSFWFKLTKAQSFDTYGPNFFPLPTATYEPQIHPRIALSTGDTYVLNPTTVINVTVGGGRWYEHWPNPSLGFNMATLGFPQSLANQFAIDTSPAVTMTNYSNFGSGRELHLHRNNYNTQVNVTKNKGSHSIKFGFTMEDQQLNRLDQTSASFGFTQTPTSGPNPTTNNGLSGNAFASMLLGAGSTGGATLANEPATSDYYFAWYVQDAWRATKNLTINYGVRYEIQPAQTERFNDQAYFNPNIVNPIGAAAGMPNLLGGIQYTSSSNRDPYNTAYNNFAPRVGLAYRIGDKLVLRTGYGITYTRDLPIYLNNPSNDGFTTTTPWTTSLNNGITVQNYWANAFPQGLTPISGRTNGLLQQVGLTVNEFDRQRPTPYIQEYSFDVQYSFGRDTVMEVGYGGNQGRKLIENGAFQADQLPDQDLALGNALLASVPNPFYGTAIASGTLSGPTVQYGQLLRPYPQYAGVGLLIVPGAASGFNALNAKITHRFAQGLTLTASYQWSKAIDDVSEDGSGTIRDYNNLSLDRSISAHDIPQSFVVNYRYEFPFGNGKTFGASWPKFLDTVAGGWSVAGIYTYHSGLPLAFSATNNTNSFGGSQLPNIVNGAQLGIANPSRFEWFNTADVVQPPAFTYGNAPREIGYVRAQGMSQMDMGITKNFTLPWEGIKLNLRADAFNAFNHNQFSAPSASLSSLTFGQITSSYSTPRNIQLALRLTF
jgi:Carboxypeptidase regulatory-like domain/TonB dependent receptor